MARPPTWLNGRTKRVSRHDSKHTSGTRRAQWGEAKLRLLHAWSRDPRMPGRYVYQHLDDLREAVRRDVGWPDMGIGQKVESRTTSDQLVDLLKKLMQERWRVQCQFMSTTWFIRLSSPSNRTPYRNLTSGHVPRGPSPRAAFMEGVLDEFSDEASDG